MYMSQFFSAPTRPDTAAGAIAQHLRVKTPGALVVATASDVELGTMEIPATAAGPATVRLRTAEGSAKMVAAGVITAGDPAYAAAGGKVAATGTVFVGTALESSTADNDVIEVLRGPNTDITAALTGSGVPINVRTRFTVAQVNAGATIVAAAAGIKYRLVNAAVIAVGGAATAHTTIDILGTVSTARKLVAFAAAQTTQSTYLQPGVTGAAILADGASFTANDANTAITIGKTGDAVATATHVDVILTYVKEAA
jgi:hypothetical protein